MGPLSTYWILLEDFKTRWPLQHFFHSFRWDKFKIIFSPITGSNGPLFETSPKFRPKCDFSYFRDKHYFWTPNYIIYELLKVNFVHYVSFLYFDSYWMIHKSCDAQGGGGGGVQWKASPCYHLHSCSCCRTSRRHFYVSWSSR